MSCKVGNQTNSQDPQAVNSRVFVGNLNTFQCSKTDVERIFQRYGRIAGISMHKGYAFIQFTNPFDARSACLGEDGRLIWGQTLDVNMVAEPKSHQTGRKRQNIAKTGNDWDYYYDSYYAQVGLPPGPRLVPPMKRPRIHGPATTRPTVKAPSPNKSSHTNNNAITNNSNASSASLTDLKTYSTPDILICGNCREHFNEVEQLIEHKKTYCKLRFTCKCHLLNGSKISEEPAALLCSQCKDSFSSAWDLMVHVQAAHMLNIYQLSSDPSSGGSSRDQSETREFKNYPNGLNPNGTLLMGDSLMEDSHCQTDLSSTTSSSSSSTSSINSSTALITPNNHLHHNHLLLQQQQLQQQQQQQQQQSHHHPYHIHNNRIEQDSPTMTADVSTSTGLENITMSSSMHHVVSSGGGGMGGILTAAGNHNPSLINNNNINNNNNNCLADNGLVGNMTPGTNSVVMTNPNGGVVMMTDGNQSGTGSNHTILMNGNDNLMCSSSQCSTSVNHLTSSSTTTMASSVPGTVTNGPFSTATSPQAANNGSNPGGQMIGGQVHNNFIQSNNNNNNNSSSSSSSASSSSTSPYDSTVNIVTSQPMEASTQTHQSMQVEDGTSLHHPENNNGPSATLTNNNQTTTIVTGGVVATSGGSVVGGGSGGVVAGVVGNGTGIPPNFDEHCSIVSTLKQEGNSIHMPFSNGQVASM